MSTYGKSRLLASATSVELIRSKITEYFYGTEFDIEDDGTLRRVSDQKHFPHYTVTSQRGRWYFRLADSYETSEVH